MRIGRLAARGHQIDAGHRARPADPIHGREQPGPRKRVMAPTRSGRPAPEMDGVETSAMSASKRRPPVESPSAGIGYRSLSNHIAARGDITATDLADAVETLRTAPISLPVSMLQLTPAAARLATDLGHPVHDCFYLALAIQTQYPISARSPTSPTPKTCGKLRDWAGSWPVAGWKPHSPSLKVTERMKGPRTDLSDLPFARTRARRGAPPRRLTRPRSGPGRRQASLPTKGVPPGPGGSSTRQSICRSAPGRGSGPALPPR